MTKEKLKLKATIHSLEEQILSISQKKELPSIDFSCNQPKNTPLANETPLLSEPHTTKGANIAHNLKLVLNHRSIPIEDLKIVPSVDYTKIPNSLKVFYEF